MMEDENQKIVNVNDENESNETNNIEKIEINTNVCDIIIKHSLDSVEDATEEDKK